MKHEIPALSLVLLVGPSGSGKSTFAATHFGSFETVSSDFCRGLVSNDENSQAATEDAFDLLHTIVGKRLARGLLTVVDATNVQPEGRKALVSLARRHHVLPAAIVLNLPEAVCRERNRDRSDRQFGPHVIRNQCSQLRRSLKSLKREGFRKIVRLDSVEEIAAAEIVRTPMWNDKTAERGPFDLIGDVHGCADELESLLGSLGYMRRELAADGHVDGLPSIAFRHPAGRRAVFVGDLTDRGPRSLDVLAIVRHMVAGGDAYCVPGNHDAKLLKVLRGKPAQLSHGLQGTWDEIEAIAQPHRETAKAELARFLDSLVSHLVFDGGSLVVAHAGLKEEMHGRGSGKVREFCLYGDTTGERDEYGLPVRRDWAADYRGEAAVVYGHTPVGWPQWRNNTVNIDTGCVFGGALTALRWPEREFVSVPAARTYEEPKRPFREKPQPDDGLIAIGDVIGKRRIETGLLGAVTIRADQSAAALETMSRFAVDPRWLITLPPTMSPSETSQTDDYLEHPNEALAYYRGQGVERVVCQRKHMGSRAIVVVCRDADAAAKRFAVDDGTRGCLYTRTGRPFFSDAATEAAILARVADAVSAAGLWERLQTDWLCLDCELMPWSAKAQALLRSQYAAVGAAGRTAFPGAIAALESAVSRAGDDQAVMLLQRTRERAEAVDRFTDAYRQYCWPVESLDDYRLAPFHLLASENAVHTDQPHEWHMRTLAELATADELLMATDHRLVALADAASCAEAVAWWEEMTAAGGEGMVVKPSDWIVRGKKGLTQPAVKCRGREYLRIIYGPDYDRARNLVRLRNRGLGRKRSLAVREFALGLEGLQRFVNREPLRRVHECAFAVLAMESEPLDPRL